MTLAELKDSLELWRRRHVYRQRKLDYYHLVNDKAGILKWERLRRVAAANIHLREQQIAEKTAPKPSARTKAIAYARTFAGVVHEIPWGSNTGGMITVWQRRLGFGPAPWCGIFAGNMLLHAGVRGVSARIASVGAIEDDAKARRGCFTGWTTNTRAVNRGDLVVLIGYGVHVAMVDSIDRARGIVYTVEGNTSSGSRGSQSNGGGVFRRARPLSIVRGFALVNYPG